MRIDREEKAARAEALFREGYRPTRRKWGWR